MTQIAAASAQLCSRVYDGLAPIDWARIGVRTAYRKGKFHGGFEQLLVCMLGRKIVRTKDEEVNLEQVRLI